MLINDNRIDVNILGRGGRTAFHWVCKSGSLDSALTLISNPSVDIAKLDKKGEGGLFFACNKGNPAVVRLILRDRRTNIRNLNLLEKNILFVACKKKYTDIIKILLATGLRININTSFSLDVNNLLSSFPESDECNALRSELYPEIEREYTKFNEFVRNNHVQESATPSYLSSALSSPISLSNEYFRNDNFRNVSQLKNNDGMDNEAFIHRFQINLNADENHGNDEE